MDEPCSALDPIATARIEDLMEELKSEFTIVIVTHNMQQAARTSDRTAFFTAEVDDQNRRVGRLVEYDVTEKLFMAPSRSPHRGLHHRAVRLSRPGGSVVGTALSAARTVVERRCAGEKDVHDCQHDGEPTQVGRRGRDQHDADAGRTEEEERAAIHQNILRIAYEAAAIKAAPGIVSTHAQTTRPATPQRTADEASARADADDRRR